MTPVSRARRRYHIGLGVSLAVYVALLVPVDIAARRGLLPAGGVGDVVAALPALAVAGVIWSILRYLSEEEDEYRRLLMAKAFIAATGLTLVITTAWGFVQNFAGAPMVSLMYVFVLFIACQAVAGTIVQWRAR